MRHFAIRAVYADEHPPGKVIRCTGFPAEGPVDALAKAMDWLGPSGYGATIEVVEEVPPCERSAAPTS